MVPSLLKSIGIWQNRDLLFFPPAMSYVIIPCPFSNWLQLIYLCPKLLVCSVNISLHLYIETRVKPEVCMVENEKRKMLNVKTVCRFSPSLKEIRIPLKKIILSLPFSLTLPVSLSSLLLLSGFPSPIESQRIFKLFLQWLLSPALSPVDSSS